MIELTQEQWQAIALEENPTVIEPASKTAYVVVPIPAKTTNNKTPVTCATRVLIKAGDNLLSRCSHYHGPQVLNGRVRNGNGCFHLGMVTGKSHVPSGLRLALAWSCGR